MEEAELEQSLELYKAQLGQVQQAIAAAGATEELQKLSDDLQELITLQEGSLLDVKKAKLLSVIEAAESSSSAAASKAEAPSSSIDDEYAAFQAALQGDLGDSKSNDPVKDSKNRNSTSPRDDSDSNSSSSDSEDDAEDGKGENTVEDDLSRLAGMKCSAPFSHDWGKLAYHNALVISADRDAQTDEILVKVMYTTPTHRSMKPCQFYLDGRCKFNEDKCKFSHGRTVELASLRDFVEADHSNLGVDTRVLACYTDGVWYPATVTAVTEAAVSVHFDDYGEDLDLDLTQVVPHAVDAEESEEEDAAEGDRSKQGSSLLAESEEEEEELPTFLWQPPKTTAAMGEWEAHTRGIGSKLMARMGYVPGQGLGSRGQGKREPVPIMLLPQGKSLDRIMELKAMAGDEGLFDAMKKLERRQRKADKRREEEARTGGGAQGGNPKHRVFDFINTKLGGDTGQAKSKGIHSGGKHSGKDNSDAGQKNISEHELHKKTDKDINLQVFKTDGEIRNVQREMDRLKQQLARNENKDRRMAEQIRTRLEDRQAYLARLQASSSALDSHRKRRSTSKKLQVF